MAARLQDGWVVVPYAGTGLRTAWIQLGDGDWSPAFRDVVDGESVLAVRPAGVTGRVPVRYRVDDVVTNAGKVTL